MPRTARKASPARLAREASQLQKNTKAAETEVIEVQATEVQESKSSAAKSGRLRKLQTTNIFPNPDQPRKLFDEAAIADLAASIQQSGLMQPIVVVKRDEGYMIVAGERRWRAHCHLKLPTIQAIVKELTESEVAELAIIENLQRANITPLEQAQAYQRMLDKGYASSVKVLAERLGIKQPWRIKERLGLLKLTPEASLAYEESKITQSQASYISYLPKEKQNTLLDLCLQGKCATAIQLTSAYQHLKKPLAPPKAQSLTLDLGEEVERSNRVALQHKEDVSNLQSAMATLTGLYGNRETLDDRENAQLDEIRELIASAKTTLDRLEKSVVQTQTLKQIIQ